jgi:transcription elongation GreA/GreB family factor
VTLSLKNKLYLYCQSFVEQKRATLENALALAKESANDDNKSSAGDKHETSRAMAQLEQEKLSAQFLEIEKQKQLLSKINSESKANKIAQGTLVKTNIGNYYIAISAGKIVIDNETYFIVSAISPIGKALIENQEQKQFAFNNREIKIIDFF